jgi:3-oxoadipate enol-lactonase
MRGAVRGLATFDSRPWLGEIGVPTLVVGGTHDTAIPQYHFDTLVNGIPEARGLLIARAGHTSGLTRASLPTSFKRNGKFPPIHV